MAETNFQKFTKYCKASGFFYAVYRGIKYVIWRIKCKQMGIDCRKFSNE